MIECKGIQEGILDIPSLTIPKGFSVITGKNGSGKTTLLELIAGIRVPKTGFITIDGCDPRSLDTGWMDETPDENILFFSVFDEIASPLVFKKTPCDEIQSRVASIAERLSLTHLLSRTTSTLSGGEKVLVALAAILVIRPYLVVLDEFDSSLDSETVSRVTDAFHFENPRYLILCTHSGNLISTAPVVICLDNGRFVKSVSGQLEKVKREWYSCS